MSIILSKLYDLYLRLIKAPKMATLLNPSDYTVAWIAVLDVEAQAAKHMLDHRHMGKFPISHGNDFVFQAGDICGYNVIIATFPAGQAYGTGSAAALAKEVKSVFTNLRFGLLVGVASGIPKLPTRDIRLGDVLVGVGDNDSAAIIPYDLIKEINNKSELLRCGRSLVETETILRSAITSIRFEAPGEADEFLPFYESMKDKSYKDGTFADPGQELDVLYEAGNNEDVVVIRPNRPLSGRSRVWYGPIGSGEKLIRNRKVRDELAGKHGIIGLEMEATGALVSIPVCVVRGVCDYGDEYEQKHWQPYAAAMAGAFAKALLAQIPPDKPQGHSDNIQDGE